MKALVFVGLGLFLVYGCSSSSDSPASSTPSTSKGAIGAGCNTNQDCVSDFCLGLSTYFSGSSVGICSSHCNSDLDCSGTLPTCGTGPDGSAVCVYDCSGFHAGFACASGKALLCGTDTSLCEECGCPDDLRCDIGVGCVTKSAVDEPCRHDRDCKTGNCSSYLGVCRVPVGSACTADNCDACQTAAGDYSFCSRACRHDTDCGTDADCLVYRNGGGFCYQRCSSLNDKACPGTCRSAGGTTELIYCECDQGCAYQTSSKQRPLGAGCTEPTQCASGNCYGGWCSQACTQTSDCGAGIACVDVPCVDSSPCGARCIPTCTPAGNCDSGFCRKLTELGTGSTTSVCDIKLPNMATCRSAGECQSGVCSTGACVAPGADKNGNGGTCTSGSDCQTNNCVSAHCRGRALLDDTCATDYDCSVGTCCLSGKHAQQCETVCL